MPIDIPNLPDIDKRLKDVLERKLNAFDAALQAEATRIVLRTQSGKDVDGAAFVPYSKAYAKSKKASGRSTSPVDLTYSGNMLTAIQTDIQRTPTGAVGTINFSSPREAAKASGNQRLRRFFGLAKEQVERILAKINAA